MSVLSDHDIKVALGLNQIQIDPLGEHAIQPASVDLHLRLQGAKFVEPHQEWCGINVIDPRHTDSMSMTNARPWFPEWECVLLEPGQLLLVDTIERIWLNNSYIGEIWGLSSRGREGLNVIQSCGILDPGFDGHVVLELTSTKPYLVRDGMRIAQVKFSRLFTPATAGYSGKYQHQTETTGSRGM